MSNKRITLFFHLLFFVVFFLAFLGKGFYYWYLLAFNILFLIFSYRLKGTVKYDKKFFYFVLPWVFANGMFFYFSLLVNKFTILLLLSFGLLLSYYYFRGLRRHLLTEYSAVMDNFSIWTDVLGLISVFLISSFAYGLNYFLNIDQWLLLLIIMSVLFLAIWQNIFVLVNDYRRSLFLSSLFLLVISPIAGALFFFPFNFNVLAIILAITYYFSIGFMRFSLLRNLTNKKIKYNLIFIITLFIVLFLTVKWR